MKEVYRDKYVVDADKPGYEGEALARYFIELVALHGGDYAETLKVNSDGRVSINSRKGDRAPALLPSLTATRMSGQGPTIEDMYLILKELADNLPGYEVSVNENRAAGTIAYRIKKADQ